MAISYKTSETLLGIETNLTHCNLMPYRSYKTSETLLGIETQISDFLPAIAHFSYKTSETLLGIETFCELLD